MTTGELATGSIGRFLTAQPMPEHLLFAEPLRRRMRVRVDDDWIADIDRGLDSDEVLRSRARSAS